MSESATLSTPAPVAATRASSRHSRWGARADILLIGLALAFAFLTGSFVARNSDFWLHVAAGRLIATGAYSYGVDPFTYTTAGHYWANHAWLSDLGMYLVHRSLGASGLVALKAGLVVAIAGVMFWMVRRRAPIWLTTTCLMMATLAMAPRLLLQSAIVSYLLLALCLYCLQAGGRALRVVPILIALWVNLDSWFVLGPLVVCLFWVGQRIEPRRYRITPWPWWLVPASLAACLISPHHVRALTLPLELSPSVWLSDFPTDPRLASVFISPWHRALLRNLELDLQAAAADPTLSLPYWDWTTDRDVNRMGAGSHPGPQRTGRAGISAVGNVR